MQFVTASGRGDLPTSSKPLILKHKRDGKCANTYRPIARGLFWDSPEVKQKFSHRIAPNSFSHCWGVALFCGLSLAQEYLLRLVTKAALWGAFSRLASWLMGKILS